MSKSYLTAAVVAAAVLAAGAWAAYRFITVPSFPELPAGSYAGTISGVGTAEPASIYLERFEDSGTFLLILFLPDFKPQAVSASAAQSKRSKGFSPLAFDYGDRRYRLTGAESATGYEGAVTTPAEGESGRWQLRPLKTEDYVNRRDESAEAKIREWLTLRGRVRDLRRGLRDLEQDLSDKQERFAKLEEHVQNTELLKQRAEEQRDTYAKELQSGIEERKSTAKAVADLVSELDLLARITKRGQAITLARRVAKRENKWYEVNWKAAEDMSGVETVLGDQSGIDLPRLDQAYRKAEQVKQLMVERNHELEKIRELEARLRGEPPPQQPGAPPPVPPPVETEEPERTPPRPGEDRSLWNKIFG